MSIREWINFWSKEGMLESIESNKKIYNFLSSAKTIGDNIAAINLAIQANHTSGSMLDHLEQHIYDEYDYLDFDSDQILKQMQDLTDGTQNNKWEEDVRSHSINVGTQYAREMDNK